MEKSIFITTKEYEHNKHNMKSTKFETDAKTTLSKSDSTIYEKRFPYYKKYSRDGNFVYEPDFKNR